ncbi:MAG: hypothetical protein ABIM88_01635 [candidate division WOR-3 bacterium]
MIGMMALFLVSSDPITLNKPDTVKKYLALLYDAAHSLPQDARTRVDTFSNGIINVNISWERFYIDYNILEDRDELVYFSKDFLLGVVLDSSRITVDITSKNHSDGTKYYASYGSVKPKGTKITSRAFFWEWIGLPWR